MTTSTDPGRLRSLFEAALDQPEAVRAAWIQAQALSAKERADLLRLLAASTAPGALDVPASARAAAIGGEEEPAAVEGLIGQRIGAFRLVRLLGQGGMATVFLGEREGGDFAQHVAVKLLRRGLYSELEQRLFRRERRMLAMLSHPHIAHLIDGGITASGIPYLVMEYVDGVPITDYAVRHGLPRDARLRLFLRICSATDAAHRQLIVHRDLKPSNILVAADGAVKLLDFGIAKLLDEDDNTQRTALAALTPDYAAPEQFAGRPTSTATDVHALGVLLHELLTGARPTRGAGGLILAPALRGDLRNIVAKASAPEPAQRYATAGALDEDITRYLDGLPVAAHPPSPWYPLRKFVQRHRAAVAASAVFVFALFAALALAQWNAHRAQREAATATAVKQFLAEVFASASPYVRPGEDVRARDLLDAGAARLRPGMAGDPAVETELLEVLARSYADLGLYAKAEPLARRALALRERLTGARSAPARAARLTLAEILQAAGGKHPQEVVALGAQVLSHAEHPDLLDMRTHAMLARNLVDQNRFAEARAEHAIAITQATALGKAAAPWLGELWLREVRLALYVQDLAGARQAMDRAAPYLPAAQRPADAMRLVEHLRTEVFARLHAPDAGEQVLPLYDKLVVEHGRVFGAAHPEHLTVLSDQASALQILGYPRQAQAVAARLAAQLRANPGIRAQDVLDELAMLPTIAAIRGDFVLAETEQHKLLTLARREFPPQARIRQFAELDSLHLRADRGDPAAARALAADQGAYAQAIRPLLLPDALRIARALRYSGDPKDALTWLRQRQAQTPRDATPAAQGKHWLLRREIGIVLAMLGREREAAAEFTALAALPPPYSGRRGRTAVAELRRWRGWLATDTDPAQALRDLDAALAVQREVYGDDSVHVAAARLFRARALAALGRDAQARHELAQARPVLAAQLLPGHWLRRQAAALQARLAAAPGGMS